MSVRRKFEYFAKRNCLGIPISARTPRVERNSNQTSDEQRTFLIHFANFNILLVRRRRGYVMCEISIVRFRA